MSQNSDLIVLEVLQHREDQQAQVVLGCQQNSSQLENKMNLQILNCSLTNGVLKSKFCQITTRKQDISKLLANLKLALPALMIFPG